MVGLGTSGILNRPRPSGPQEMDTVPQTKTYQAMDSLQGRLTQRRSEGCAVVHTHGTFDLLHIGAVRHLEQAKKLGGLLAVTITPDADLLRAGTPALFNQELRAEALAALSCVDYVAVAKKLDGPRRHPVDLPGHIRALGRKRSGRRRQLARSARRKRLSSAPWEGDSSLWPPRHAKAVRLNHHVSPTLTPEASEFLNSFRARYSRDDVTAALEDARATSVLFLGETIIDEYQYCESIGKSGKEPVLAVRYISDEKFAGGVLATANQSAAFCDRIGMLTLLGSEDSHEEFVREKLNPKIDTSFLYMAGARTIVKRRMVETYPFQKLFEVYFMDQEIPEAVNEALYARLQTMLPRYDAVVVTDYGHGLMTPEIIELLCASDCFLAVNTQTNAANQGFNSPSKYRRADFVCLSEKELRLEVRHRTRDLHSIVAETAERLSCQRMMITRGRSGSLCYHARQGFFAVPSFTTRIVDRIGAGDALLAVASLCAAKDVPMEIIGFIGNAVGAQAVETVGNRSVVAPEVLTRQINDMMSYDHWISTQ